MKNISTATLRDFAAQAQSSASCRAAPSPPTGTAPSHNPSLTTSLLVTSSLSTPKTHMHTQTPTKRRRFYLRHLQRQGIVRLDGVEVNHQGTVRLHATPRGDVHISQLGPIEMVGMRILATEMMAHLQKHGLNTDSGPTVIETGDAFHSNTGDAIDADEIAAGIEVAARLERPDDV